MFDRHHQHTWFTCRPTCLLVLHGPHSPLQLLLHCSHLLQLILLCGCCLLPQLRLQLQRLPLVPLLQLRQLRLRVLVLLLLVVRLSLQQCGLLTTGASAAHHHKPPLATAPQRHAVCPCLWVWTRPTATIQL